MRDPKAMALSIQALALEPPNASLLRRFSAHPAAAAVPRPATRQRFQDEEPGSRATRPTRPTGESAQSSDRGDSDHGAEHTRQQ